MLIVTLRRDNNGEQGVKKAFHDLEAADDYITVMCEKLEEDGWTLTENEKNDKSHGLIEFVNRYERYGLQLVWRTLNA